MINEYLKNIKSAIYGKDVRDSIHDAIKACYDDATGNPESIAAAVQEVERQGKILQEGIGGVTQDSEVMAARVGYDGVIHASLGERLDQEQSQLSESIADISSYFKTDNLFDKKQGKIGYYVGNNGVEAVATGNDYSCSDYCYIPSNFDTVRLSHCTNVCFYSSDNESAFISKDGSITVERTDTVVNIPSNARYLRFTYKTVNADNLIVNGGSILIPYTEYMSDDKYIENVMVEKTENLFNPYYSQVGKYVNAQGLVVVATGNDYSVSGRIYVNGANKIFVSHMDNYVFIKDNTVISYGGAITTNTDNNVLSVPSDSDYIQYTYKTEYVDDMMVCVSDKKRNYVPSAKLQSGTEEYLFERFNTNINLTKYKKIKLIGDSITAGVGGTGYSEDGAEIVDGHKRNPNGYCWAKKFAEYVASKRSDCAVVNNAIAGINTSHILQWWDSLVSDEDDVIICMIGTNDRTTQYISTLTANLEAIYKKASDMGKRIVFMANVPASVANEARTACRFHMEDVDMCVQKVSANHSQAYISVYKEFIKYCDYNNITIDSLLSDGLHPNDNGYDVMFYIISNALGFSTKRDGAIW